MSNDRWNVLVIEENKEGKKFYTKIGQAVKMNNGDGWNVYLSAHPIDRYMMILPPRDENTQAPQTNMPY